MAREPCCAIYTRTCKMERMIQLRRLPTPTFFIPRSSARRSGSPLSPLKSHQPSWKVDSPKGFRWRKSQNCFRCRGQSIVPCSADFRGSP
jgi:hypothetical protein